jgi:large subunit ribosomal protein L17
MRHAQIGRKLGVDSSHRVALLRSLTLALIESETIKTTPARAKELRWYAERMVTLAKRGDLNSRRHMVKLLGSSQTNTPGENRVRNAMEKVYTVLAPRFKTRPGGYTRIIRLADRRAGDNAEMCVMQYLPSEEKKEDKKPVKKAVKASPKADKVAKAPKSEKASDKPQDKPAKSKKKAAKEE